MTIPSIPSDFLTLEPSNQVYKKITKNGTDSRIPNRPGTTVKVHYEGSLWCDGSVFDSSYTRGDPIEFALGKGQVIKGWDIGIASMQIGEQAELLIQPEYAYGANGSPPKIPGNSVLLFKVELVSMDESTAEMSIAEKIESATSAKEEGNSLFKASSFEQAAKSYQRGLGSLKETFGAELDEGKVISDLKVSLNSNLAACLLKTKDASAALKACEEVLAIEPDHQKANYRFYQALLLQGKYDEAIAFLESKRLSLGKDVDVDQETLKAKKLRAQGIAKEKQLYQKMFA